MSVENAAQKRNERFLLCRMAATHGALEAFGIAQHWDLHIDSVRESA